MRVLFVGNETQQVTHIAYALDRMGHEVAVYPQPIEKVLETDLNMKNLYSFLQKSALDFVISNVFHPYLAQVTHDLNLKYVVYGMDSPMFAIYRHEKESRYSNTYLFLLDRMECERLKKRGYTNVYHLPLGSDDYTAGSISISDEEIRKYQCDISFVGSLYSDNVYDKNITRMPDTLQNNLAQILEDSALYWDGIDRLTLQLVPELIRKIEKVFSDLEKKNTGMDDAEYIKYRLLARKWTHIERTLLLELLAEYYDLCLYTWDHQIVPDVIRRFPTVQFEDSLKIYYSTKINLNITLRSIESGIPLRIFDVMSVGGFVLSNWQPEIPELFEEGKEIVTFKTPEEMLEKVDYYLHHEEERQRIALNGYRKVKECHTFEHRLEKIISILYPSP